MSGIKRMSSIWKLAKKGSNINWLILFICVSLIYLLLDLHFVDMLTTFRDNNTARKQKTRKQILDLNGETGIYDSEVLKSRSTVNYPINCANIHMVKIIKKIGKGDCKQAYLGVFRGINVVIKIAQENKTMLTHCLNNFVGSVPSDICYSFCFKQVVKDIMFVRSLSHPNLIRLLGYCVRNDDYRSMDVAKVGAISVFEYGDKVTHNMLQSIPWSERLRHAIDIAKLLHYFQHSPLGSLVYTDLKLAHFVLVHSTLKLIDIDSLSGTEEACRKSYMCPLRLPCVKGFCIGANAVHNLRSMHEEFFKSVLATYDVPESIKVAIIQIKRRLARSLINAEVLVEELNNTRNIILKKGSNSIF